MKKATDAFNSIPNLAAEDRLLRMSDFADAAMERAKEMPDGKAKDKELARVTKLKASIDGKKAKLLEAERRRDEWERRIKRVDSDGVPVVKNAAAARERARREARAPASARRGTDTGGDDDMKGRNGMDPRRRRRPRNPSTGRIHRIHRMIRSIPPRGAPPRTRGTRPPWPARRPGNALHPARVRGG